MGQNMLKLIRDPFCIQLWIQIVHIMFDVHFLQIRIDVYKMFVCKMYPIFQQTFAYILYTKCIQNVCIYSKSNVPHISTNFCIHFVYKIQLTQIFGFCIQNVYKSLSNVVYILYNFCIQNVYTVSVWVLISSCNILKFFRRNLWFKNLYLIKRNLLIKNLYLIKPIQIEKSCHYHQQQNL